MFHEKSVVLPSSGAFLKQLADGTNLKAQENLESFDDITPLDLPSKPASTKHCPASASTKQPLGTKLHSAKLPSSINQLPQKVVSVKLKQPQCRPRVTHQLHVEHGLPLDNSVHFNSSARCILSDNLSLLVTRLVEGALCFEGSRLIDKEDLLALRGVRPTPEGKYLTNFCIEGYLDVIARQGRLQGQNVEYLGWERFERVVGTKPAEEILCDKAPLMQQDIVLVPCNPLGTQHWFLLAVLPKDHIILVLDSMAAGFVKPTAKTAINKIWMLLKELDSSIDASKWSFFSNRPTDIPQQPNGYDCGVFVCLYARCLVLKHPVPDHIPTFREVMVLELHQEKLYSFGS